MSGYQGTKIFGFITTLWCLSQLLGYAQKPAADIKKVVDYYNSLTVFSVDVTAHFYAQETAQKPSRTLDGYTRISGNMSHSIFDGRENIVGNDFILVADHGNKTIYYSPREKTAKQKVSKGMEVLDSAFMAMYHIAVASGDGSVAIYKFTPKKSNSGFKSITIKINRDTKQLTEIQYIHEGDVKYKKTVIKYSHFNPAWVAGKYEFAEKKFISGKYKQANLQPEFSSYKLINSYNYDPKKNLIE